MSASEHGAASLLTLSISRKGLTYVIKPLLLAVCSILLLPACQPTSEITEKDLAGLWLSNDGIYVRLEADGTLTAAVSIGGLSTNPQERAVFRIEGDEFVWISNDAMSLCKGVARYKIALGEEGELNFSVIEDDCQLRREDLEYGPLKRISE